MPTQQSKGRDSSRVSARRAATRRRIRNAAASQLRADHGYAALTPGSVCERAGLTRGAFYSNYRAIDEVLTELLIDHCESTDRAVRQWVNESEEDDANGLHGLVTKVAADPLWFILCSWAWARPGTGVREHVDKLINATIDSIGEALDLCANRASGRGLRVPASSAAQLLITILAGHHAICLFGNRTATDDVISTALSASIFFDESTSTRTD
jgi:AcrR family transcriptional regulator